MALPIGTKLGPYEIESALGAGGMGEVYRARDTRFDRTVAIKILPAHLSDNPEAKQRFDREARAISSLNHPNICTLHDVGHQDQWTRAANIREGKIFRRVARLGKVWGGCLSQNVVWYVVRICCERAGLEHIAPHDLRRTCAKLCHDRGGELEQIQFLLGHASVQTTERYLGCKQNLGHPVNDLFDLRTDVQQAKHDESIPANPANEAVETMNQIEIECHDEGSENAHPVHDARPLSLPEPTQLVEVGKTHRPQSLRRCSASGAAGNDSESKANGQRDPAVVGSMGSGTIPDPKP